MAKVTKLAYPGTCTNCHRHLDENSIVKFGYDAYNEKTFIDTCQYCDPECRSIIDTSSFKPTKETLAESIRRRNAKRTKLLKKSK
jgi:hypothetical protein